MNYVAVFVLSLFGWIFVDWFANAAKTRYMASKTYKQSLQRAIDKERQRRTDTPEQTPIVMEAAERIIGDLHCPVCESFRAGECFVTPTTVNTERRQWRGFMLETQCVNPDCRRWYQVEV